MTDPANPETLKRFVRVKTGDANEYAFKDKTDGTVYVFDTEEEAFTKMAELLEKAGATKA